MSSLQIMIIAVAIIVPIVLALVQPNVLIRMITATIAVGGMGISTMAVFFSDYTWWTWYHSVGWTVIGLGALLSLYLCCSPNGES